jgi:hypothetical protein
MWTMSVGNIARKWYRRARPHAELAMSGTSKRRPPPSPNLDLSLWVPDKYPLFRHYRPLE